MDLRRPTARTGLAALGLILAASGLTGCGGGGSGDQPAATRTVTVSAAPTPSTSATPPPSTPPAALASPPVTYTEALDHVSAATKLRPPVPLGRFVSPTGNIYCTIAEGGDGVPPSCELGEGKVDRPSACPDSPTHFVGRVELADGAWRQVCNSDTIRLPGAPTLGYGSVAQVPGGEVQCLSEQIGMTCVDIATQHGFFMSRGHVDVVG